MKTQTFGVEIEMTGITRQQAAVAVRECVDGRVERIHDFYDAYAVTGNDGRVWKLMSDGSIHCRRREGRQLVSADASHSVEFVTPILHYDDIELLQEITRALREAGAVSGPEYGCGIHVHIGAANHTPATLKNLVNLMAAKEELIYKAFQIAESRVHYCKKVNEKLLEAINKNKPQTLSALADIWYAGSSAGRSQHYNHTRYHGLNLHAVFTHGTIEFRLFNGTLHAGKIRAYIVFCLAVSHQALCQKTASPRRTGLTDNEKYTFRCWLLRLGLIGDEFKNCREHLMANLSGNSAWRHGAA